MVNKLEVPDQFACPGIQSQQTVGKQIFPNAIGAIHIISGRTGWEIGNVTLLVE